MTQHQHMAEWPHAARRRGVSAPAWTAPVVVFVDAMTGAGTLVVAKIRPRVVSGGLPTEG